MTDFVTINSIEQLDERHASELEHLEVKLKRLQIAKKTAKKERESMKKKHEDEKAKLLFSEDDKIELEKLDLSQDEPSGETQPVKNNENEEIKNEEQKISKTEKRRRKKEAEEKAKKDRIKAALKESEEKFLRGELTPKLIEQNSIQSILTCRGLKVHSINSDGDCLYSSVSHQLEKYDIKKSATELRKLTVDTIKSNSDDFIGFLEEDIDIYCNKILNDNVWGGQIEIISLSKGLQCKICVIQSEMPNELQFGESEDKKLTIVYYRHLCTLGEHYNSTV